jgi:hypothetical protein
LNAHTPIPELARHLRAIAEGNRQDRDSMADERLDELVFLCEIVASHCTSAREAAWRRDQTLLGDHMRHAWEGLQAARSLFKALAPDASKERA